LAARGLGESLVGALLISSFCKQGERVNLNIQGSGFIRQALVDAYPDGTVRGYVIDRPEDQQPERDPATEGPWGAGLLSVLRTKVTEEHKQPYIGTVPLVTGHLAKDLTFYWAQSEQIPSAVGLIVNLDDKGDVTAAGGFLIQALPGASPAEVRTIEGHINHMESLAEQLATEENPLHILSKIFQSTAFIIVEERPLEFKCSCSWERVRRALTLVGPAELQAMLAQDHHATVRCDFCTKEYQVDAAGLEKLIQETNGGK
jgi:molecular chaperone Hsp33